MISRIFVSTIFALLFVPLAITQELIWTVYTDTNNIVSGSELTLDENDNIYVGATGQEDMVLLKYDKDGVIDYVVVEPDAGPITRMVSGIDGKIYQAGSRINGKISPDALLKAYYPDGSIFFTQTYGFAVHPDKFEDVIIDVINNIYTTGYTVGNYGNLATLTIRYWVDGTPEWIKKYNKEGKNCRNYAVRKNDAGEVFTMGFQTPNFGARDDEILVLKYNVIGTLLYAWTFPIPGYVNCYPKIFLLDASDNMYIGGYASNTIGDEVGFILKVNNGNLEWSHIETSPDQSVSFLTGDFDTDGNIVFAGTYTDVNTDAYFVKYGTNGAKLNEGFYSSAFDINDGIYGMCVKDDFVYFCGASEGLETTNDMLALKVNSDFELMWDIRFNSSSNGLDHAHRICIDSEDNVVMTGFTISESGNYCRVWKYSNPLGISDASIAERSVMLFPNPAGSSIHVQNMQEAEYKIISQSGAKLDAGVMKNSRIDVSILAPGIYLLHILHENISYNAKFVKQ